MSDEPAPGAPNAVRGIVIVLVAGLLGVFLLARGGTTSLLDSGDPVVADTPVPSTTGNVPTIAPATTAPEAPPADTRPPGEVSIAVYNATAGAITGAAGDAQSRLVPLGYQNISLADAPGAIEATAVYFAEGFEGDARAIADALGYDPGVVAPAEGATNNPGEGSGASIVVVIGTDAAAG